MSPEEFSLLSKKLRPYTDYLCLHVLGEPTTHPQLDKILSICDSLGYKVILTTNGTLLKKCEAVLFKHSSLYKVNISLHSKQANPQFREEYYSDCIDFAVRSSEKSIITVLRLWNLDGMEAGENSENGVVFSLIKEKIPGFWSKNGRGYTVREKLFLEYDERFVWPNINADQIRACGRCRALIDHIAVLVDGTVVPCCLDGEGCIPLGNLFTAEPEEILSSDMAVRMKEGFLKNRLFHPLCKTCGYATRFDKK